MCNFILQAESKGRKQNDTCSCDSELKKLGKQEIGRFFKIWVSKGDGYNYHRLV